MKKNFFFIFFILGFVISSYTQTTKLIENSAVLLVHNDLNDFSIPSYKCFIDSILTEYTASVLKSDGIFDVTFISVKPICRTCEECTFLLAYSKAEKRFFRLQGFKNNEFNEFYNLVLLSGDVSSLNEKNKGKTFSQIIEHVHIEGIDLKKLYKNYYKKYKKCLFDASSCYRKSIVRKY